MHVKASSLLMPLMRCCHAPTRSSARPVPPALLEKQQELAVLTRLKTAVLALEERAARLAEGADVMADGGDGTLASRVAIVSREASSADIVACLPYPDVASLVASRLRPTCALPWVMQLSLASCPTGPRSSASSTTQVRRCTALLTRV